MPIRFPLKARSLVLCDFDRGGFRAPEMVKKRPVVVMAGRLPHRNRLHTIVPLSGTPPPFDECLYQSRLEIDPLPAPYDEAIWWAKADMITTVSFDRLDLFRSARDPSGKRKYYTNLKVTEDQLKEIQRAVLCSLGLGSIDF
jgi:uncharacterized protein YifN (PemK superfamily)